MIATTTDAAATAHALTLATEMLWAWGFCHFWDAVAFGARCTEWYPVLYMPASVLPDDIKLLPGAILPPDEAREVRYLAPNERDYLGGE